MSSEIDICNLALARLGDEATVASIDPPEGSAQAEQCARFYSIARDTLLEMHDWRFSVKRVMLALSAASDTWEWAYAYAVPANYLRLLKVLPQTGSAQDDTESFDQMVDADDGQVILTNCEEASLIYTTRVTDTTRFSPLFVDALGWLLASYLAGPIIKGDAGKAESKACLAHFGMTLAQAKISDANQRKIEPTHSPSWMAVR